MKSITFTLVVCILFVPIRSYKILGVYPLPSKSHFYIGHALMEGLAKDGHDVTVISPFNVSHPHENYRHILLETSYELFQKKYAKNNFLDLSRLYFWDMVLKYYRFGVRFTNITFSSANFQKFLRTEQHFDVIVIESCLQDALYALSQHFQAPLIVTTASGATKFSTDLVGSPNFPSYIPHIYTHYTDRMTFWQRIYNSLSFWFEDLTFPIYFAPKQQEIMEKSFTNAKNWPSLEEIKRNVSLVLLNTHVTYGTPRPYPQNMIEVGGIQIKSDVDPLPVKIQQFLDEAKDGVIYLSLGSNVLLTKLSKHQIDAILNGFSAYPSTRLLIKSDKHLIIPSHKQSDVLVEPWFPQQSILAHKSVTIFISHGGILSTSEAVYFGKPVIGISVFFDQHSNMQIAQQKGHGISIPIDTLNEDNFKSAVNTIMKDSRHNVRLSSARFRDQLKSPLETAMHWVKHVAKNKGAPYLKSVSVDLPFYVLYNLDVWAFIGGGFTLIIFLIVKRVNSFINSLKFKHLNTSENIFIDKLKEL
ncbi:UDP-glucuronosyltransferase 2B15-like isoform X2 [Contarinia nasturtii]|uniref:UDP-glucuronosyltransferase 2B15-like isoform X2 n=1 Tax=Contarinia nasturtii TaxID=265458 RepID=UPI0012D48B14|nr:UDP-glucuronosyltransferase 2B15-like isoform X2 [Contarinia nasturtii]